MADPAVVGADQHRRLRRSALPPVRRDQRVRSSAWTGCAGTSHSSRTRWSGGLEDVEDFLRVEDFAYGVKQVTAPDRWSLVGEAAAFADPFYSPGSDFIATSNTFACDVATRGLDGEDVSERAEYFNDYYLRAFRYTVAKYEDQYPVMGNPWVMSPKIVWDVANLHVLPILIMKGKLDDLDFMRSVHDVIDRFFELNLRVARLFRDWHAREQRPWQGIPSLGGPVAPVAGIIASLDQEYDDQALREKLAGNLALLEAMAIQIFHKAAASLPEQPDASRPVNPYAIGLDPSAWEADGLYGGDGLTLEQAEQRAQGVGFMWLDRPPATGPPPWATQGPPQPAPAA